MVCHSTEAAAIAPARVRPVTGGHHLPPLVLVGEKDLHDIEGAADEHKDVGRRVPGLDALALVLAIRRRAEKVALELLPVRAG